MRAGSLACRMRRRAALWSHVRGRALPKIACPATRMRAPAATTLASGLLVDAAIDLDWRRRPSVGQHRADAAQLFHAVGNEGLSAKSRVDRHHEHVVQIAGDVLQRDCGRRRVQHGAGTRAELLDEADGPMQVRHRLDVDRHHVGAGLHERLDVAVRFLDHQVHVERRGTPRF